MAKNTANKPYGEEEQAKKPVADPYGLSTRPPPMPRAQPVATQTPQRPVAPPVAPVPNFRAQVTNPYTPPRAQAPAAPVENIPQQGPTNFLSFDRYFGANAGAAQNMATQTAQKVAAAGAKARQGIESTNDAYYENDAVGDLNFSDDVRRDVTGATDQLAQLGDDDGIQALQGGNRFDAMLTGRAGADQFSDVQKRFAGLDKAIEGSGVEAERVRALRAAQTKQVAANSAATTAGGLPTNRLNPRSAAMPVRELEEDAKQRAYDPNGFTEITEDENTRNRY